MSTACHILLDLPQTEWKDGIQYIIPQILPDLHHHFYDANDGTDSVDSFLCQSESRIAITQPHNIDYSDDALCTKPYIHHCAVLCLKQHHISHTPFFPATQSSAAHYPIIYLDIPIRLDSFVQNFQYVYNYTPEQLSFFSDHYTLYTKEQKLTHISGNAINLTKNETLIFLLLLQKPGYTINFSNIAHAIWPQRPHYQNSTLQQYLLILRQKIDHLNHTTCGTITPNTKLVLETNMVNFSVKLYPFENS